jgi:hypothetical protein
MLTEEEALTKWCPFARFKFAGTSDNPSANREGGPSMNPWLKEGTRCLASGCMAWRHQMAEFTPAGSDPFSNMKPKKPTGRGWCGLAGPTS